MLNPIILQLETRGTRLQGSTHCSTIRTSLFQLKLIGQPIIELQEDWLSHNDMIGHTDPDTQRCRAVNKKDTV